MMKNTKDINNSIVIEIIDRDNESEVIEEIEKLLSSNNNIKYKLFNKYNNIGIDEEYKIKYKDAVLKKGSKVFLRMFRGNFRRRYNNR